MPRSLGQDVTPRKRTVRKTTTSRNTTRRAPTRAPVSAKDHSSLKMVIAAAAGFFVVSGASVAIGMSDQGQINVAMAIASRIDIERAEAEARGEEYVPPSVTSRTQAQKPNGGLKPKGLVASPEPQKPEPAPTPEENASSTEEEAVEDAEESESEESVESSEDVASDTIDSEASDSDTTEATEGVSEEGTAEGETSL